MPNFTIRGACRGDVPTILGLIRELADFEKLSHLMVADEALLADALFGQQPACECLLGEEDGAVVAFALFFHNFSTFLGRRGLYLEDLYVQPAHRARGHAQALLKELARIAVNRGCGRFEWSVLDWNEDAIRFYRKMGADMMPDWRICRLTGAELAALAKA